MKDVETKRFSEASAKQAALSYLLMLGVVRWGTLRCVVPCLGGRGKRGRGGKNEGGIVVRERYMMYEEREDQELLDT